MLGDENPFVLFRRYADEQFAHMLGTSSTAMAELHRAIETAHADALSRFERAYERTTSPERRQTDCLGRSFGHSDPVPSPLGTTSTRQTATHSETDEEDAAGFFALSPYSPLRLEQHPQLSSQTAKWRHAFEDLMAVQQQGRLPVRRDVDLARAQTGKEWISRLLSPHAQHQHWNEWFPRERFLALSELEDHTEADMYERFLSRSLARPENKSHDAFDADNSSGDAKADSQDGQDMWYCVHPARARFEAEADGRTSSTDAKKPQVLSTLTTTERRLLPDGSSTTRTVLKRRFADGSEEVSESSDTRPALASLGPVKAAAREAATAVGAADHTKQQSSWWGGLWSS